MNTINFNQNSAHLSALYINIGALIFKSKNNIKMKITFNKLFIGLLSILFITMVSTNLSAANTSSWNKKPTSVAAGQTYTVKVNYTLNEPGLLHVQIFNKSWTKIGQVYSTSAIPAGSGTATLKLPINTGTPSANGNILQAKLLKSSWADLGVKVLEVVNITGGGGGSNCLLGEWCATDPSGTQYYGSNHQQTMDLGNGYSSNWWLGGHWRGPIKAHFGTPPTSTGGTNFWMEWNNNNDDSKWTYHAEFDVRIQKSRYLTREYGYSRKLNQINGDITCSMNGQWSPGSKGRAHINMTVWITKEADRGAGDKCDIIIHAWDNSGDVGSNPAWTKVGPNLESRGIQYQVFQRKGDEGELASFNIIPISNTNKNPYLGNFPTSVVDKKIDVRVFVNHIIDHANGAASAINNEWYIHDLEWTITGQSRQLVGDDDIPASEGRWTFNSYFIPNLNASTTSLKVNGLSTNDDIVSKFAISPNPFTNSFDVETSLNKAEPISIELFAQNGRLIKVIESKVNNGVDAESHIKTVDTSKLPSGIYFLQLRGADFNKVQKLIKL